MISALLSLTKERQFWVDYLWKFTEELSFAETFPDRDEGEDEDEDYTPYPQLEDATVRFEIASGAALILGLDANLDMATLKFESSTLGAEAFEIGWDDGAHWHPYALRWEELEAVCQALGRQAEWSIAPYLPLLYLYRFAPVTTADEEKQAAIVVSDAWRSTGLFTEAEVQEITRVTLMISGVNRHWEQDAQGHWELVGEDAYSLRVQENKEFPIDAFEDALRRAALYI